MSADDRKLPHLSNQSKLVSALGWVARIYGTFFFLFVLVFTVASLFGEEGPGTSVDVWLEFLIYPVLFLVGLAMALKWPGIGGLLVTAIVLGIIVEEPAIRATDSMTLLQLAAGLLYLVYWYFARDAADTGEQNDAKSTQ